MNVQHHTICLISAGLSRRNFPLQPWRYLFELAKQLQTLGYQVSIISDGIEDTNLDGITTHRIPSVSNSWWRPNRELASAVSQIKPDIVVWHLGLTSFLHQRFFTDESIPIIGVFTSPIYDIHDLKVVGLKKLVTGYQLSLIHVLGTLIPNWFLKKGANKNDQLRLLVTQTETTRQQLLKTGIWTKEIEVISPGVDAIWQQFCATENDSIQVKLGYKLSDNVILYFGSPAPLRGLHTLIKAVQKAALTEPSIKLLILSRRHADELTQEDKELQQLLSNPEIKIRSQVISGYLEPDNLVEHLNAADIVALPFELVPSDAPLSLLEAQALGKPVVTTTVASLPELVDNGSHYLARPADVASLADVLIQAINDLKKKESNTPWPTRDWQQMGSEWSKLIQTL